jgi:hypothetical protein
MQATRLRLLEHYRSRDPWDLAGGSELSRSDPNRTWVKTRVTSLFDPRDRDRVMNPTRHVTSRAKDGGLFCRQHT